MNDHIAATAKQMRQVFAGLLIHRDTERLQTEITRLLECMPGILDAITRAKPPTGTVYPPTLEQ